MVDFVVLLRFNIFGRFDGGFKSAVSIDCHVLLRVQRISLSKNFQHSFHLGGQIRVFGQEADDTSVCFG